MNNYNHLKNLCWLIFLCISSILFLKNCKQDDIQSECSCESEALTTIPETCNLIGRLSFKSENAEDPFFNNHYWITFIEHNCSNCVHHMIICNHEILTEKCKEVRKLSEDEFIQIKFSGHLKEICNDIFTTENITYKHITLTSIELVTEDGPIHRPAS